MGAGCCTSGTATAKATTVNAQRHPPGDRGERPNSCSLYTEDEMDIPILPAAPPRQDIEDSGGGTDSKTDSMRSSGRKERSTTPLSRQRPRLEDTDVGSRLPSAAHHRTALDSTPPPQPSTPRRDASSKKASMSSLTKFPVPPSDPTFVSINDTPAQNGMYVFSKCTDDKPRTPQPAPTSDAHHSSAPKHYAEEDDEVTFNSSDGTQMLGVRVPSMNSSRTSLPMASASSSSMNVAGWVDALPPPEHHASMHNHSTTSHPQPAVDFTLGVIPASRNSSGQGKERLSKSPQKESAPSASNP
jgi:hypothetical protein